MKKCSKCGETKASEEFSKASFRPDNLQNRCKVCSNTYAAAWRALNKNYWNAWLENNREKKLGYHSSYRSRNKAKRREAAKKWYAANADKILAWQKNNPELCRIYQQNKRARRLNGGKLSLGLAKKLFALQRGKCACGCKQPLGDNYHLDHVMPLALGGTNTDDNIQLLRAACNHQKHAKHPVEFMQERGFLI